MIQLGQIKIQMGQAIIQRGQVMIQMGILNRRLLCMVLRIEAGREGKRRNKDRICERASFSVGVKDFMESKLHGNG